MKYFPKITRIQKIIFTKKEENFMESFNSFTTASVSSLNNVFLVTNRLKVNSIFWLIISFTNVLLVFIFLNTTSLGIYAVAGVSKVTGILGNLIFVPLYACKCLKIKWNTFYPIIFRYIGTTFIMIQ